MKVLAVNSSPRGSNQSKTELMLNCLVKGMRDASAEVEIIALREKTIKPCKGCFTCWTKTPGVCIHQDEMTKELFPKWRASDLVIYATPLYNYTMTALLKAFIERTLPSNQPFFEIHEGRMFHPLRHKTPAVVILSVSGMPDEGHFGALSAHVRYLYASPGRRLLAEIYRPAAEAMTHPFFKDQLDEILDATTQAGRELICSLGISPETLKRITRPLVDAESFAEGANEMWRSLIAEGREYETFTK
jgi:multimeric flavodoxin WrbA